MPLRIKISNLNKRRINQKAIKKTAIFILQSFKKDDALVDITFVSNRKIRTLNKKYMRRNESTDVLSFLLEEKKLIGDIYISTDMAYNNAKRFKTGFAEEVHRYVIHGLLHFLGFRDRTIKEKNKIRKLEDKFLQHSFVIPAPAFAEINSGGNP